MTHDAKHSFDLSTLDSALADAAYAPEEIAVLDGVLADVCRRAGMQLALNDGLRNLLAAAILEGALLGYREHDSLATFALRVLPEFRDKERRAGDRHMHSAIGRLNDNLGASLNRPPRD